ncbi:MAG: ribosomal protein methyltransferase [Oscillospiraceae bacterium]|nr:ribosomal protein methyltransferase [Oscillospiraceae bacterium]
MDDITWLEISIDAPAAELELLSAQLTANGLTGLVIEDEADFQQFLEQNHQYWDFVDDELLNAMKGVARVKFYVTDDEEGQRQLSRYTVGLEGYSYASRPLKEHDWATSWQKYYKPLAVGERIYIVPQWEREIPVPEGRTAVYLNPGLTFGTGGHASTQLCLEGLEHISRPGCTVLDLGCGSGILSVAALCLGASRAVGVDIDPKAVDVAYENAGLNGIGRDRYLVRAGNVLADEGLVSELARERYDIILANIVADVIIPLSAFARRLMKEGAVFLCSGIIDQRAGEVEAALVKNGFTIMERREKNGWVALTAQ